MLEEVSWSWTRSSQNFDLPLHDTTYSIFPSAPKKQSFFREMKRPVILESFESTSSAGPSNRHIEWPQTRLSQHSLEPVLTLSNIHVFFNINKPRNRLFILVWKLWTVHAPMFVATAILSCVFKIRGLFQSTKWRHLKMSNLKLSRLGVSGKEYTIKRPCRIPKSKSIQINPKSNTTFPESPKKGFERFKEKYIGIQIHHPLIMQHEIFGY